MMLLLVLGLTWLLVAVAARGHRTPLMGVVAVWSLVAYGFFAEEEHEVTVPVLGWPLEAGYFLYIAGWTLLGAVWRVRGLYGTLGAMLSVGLLIGFCLVLRLCLGDEVAVIDLASLLSYGGACVVWGLLIREQEWSWWRGLVAQYAALGLDLVIYMALTDGIGLDPDADGEAWLYLGSSALVLAVLVPLYGVAVLVWCRKGEKHELEVMLDEFKREMRS